MDGEFALRSALRIPRADDARVDGGEVLLAGLVELDGGRGGLVLVRLGATDTSVGNGRTSTDRNRRTCFSASLMAFQRAPSSLARSKKPSRLPTEPLSLYCSWTKMLKAVLDFRGGRSELLSLTAVVRAHIASVSTYVSRDAFS